MAATIQNLTDVGCVAVIKVFGEQTLRLVLPKVIRESFRQGADEAHQLLADLGIDDIFESRRPNARIVCAETIRQLSCEAREGRTQARESLTDFLLSPTRLDDTREVLRALVDGWHSDLVSALGAVCGDNRVVAKGNRLQIFPTQDGRDPFTVRAAIESVIQQEHEHADWIVSLLVMRAAMMREDLDDIAVSLIDFSRQRGQLSMLLCGPLFRSSETVQLAPISTLDEEQFIHQLRHVTDDYFRELDKEPLPEPIADLVEQHIRAPAYFRENSERLQSLVLDSELLPRDIPAAERISDDDVVLDMKVRAFALMSRVYFESLAAHERASWGRRRCAPLNEIPSDEASHAVQVSQLLERLRDFLEPVCATAADLDRALHKIQMPLLGELELAERPFSKVQVLSAYIPADETVGNAARLLLVKIGLDDRETPWSAMLIPDDQNEELSEELAEGTEAEVLDRDPESEMYIGSHLTPQDSDYTNVPIEGDSEGDGGVEVQVVYHEPFEPLHTDFCLLRAAPGQNFLMQGESLVRWFGEFQDFLIDPPSPVEASGGDAEFDPVDRSDYAAFEAEGDESWRYYGRTHEECERACAGLFSVIAKRYPEAWELLPLMSRVSPTLIDIRDISPIQQALDALHNLESHYGRIKALSSEERERVKDWLSVYADEYEESPLDLLMSASLWPLVAKVHPDRDASFWLTDGDARPELDPEPGELFDRSFYDWHLCLLNTALTPQGIETAEALLHSRHIYFDGLSSECIACLNSIPAKELQARIKHRAEPERMRSDWVCPPHWFDCAELEEPSDVLALRAQFGAIWADIWRSYKRGLL